MGSNAVRDLHWLITTYLPTSLYRSKVKLPYDPPPGLSYYEKVELKAKSLAFGNLFIFIRLSLFTKGHFKKISFRSFTGY